MIQKIKDAVSVRFERFVSGWKAVNHKKYIGYWVERDFPLPALMIAILTTCNKAQMKALNEWLNDRCY